MTGFSFKRSPSRIDDPCRDEEGIEVVTLELIRFNGHAVDLAFKMSDSVISGNSRAIGEPGVR